MLALLLVACAGGGTPDDTVDRVPALEAPAWVALPFVARGDDPPSAELAVAEVAGAASLALSVEVAGPFALDGDTSALDAGEARTWTVRFTGDTSEPTWATGSVAITMGAQSLWVGLAAVVGDADLPAVSWDDAGRALTATVALSSAPFPEPGGGWTDPSVFLAIPVGLSPTGGVHAVTHLHGHNAQLATTVPSFALVEQHVLSGRDAVLIVPQGPVNAASGDFGKLMEPGGHARLVRDVIALLYRDGYVLDPTPGRQVITSHSGGYRAASRIVDGGGLPVVAVHLFDSLYGESGSFEAFAAAGGTLRSSYTASGGTVSQNQALASALSGDGVRVTTETSDETLSTSAVTIASSASGHGACVTDQREYARWLVHSGLPPHALAPPELIEAVVDGGLAEVAWRAEHGLPPRTVRIEGSDDGTDWTVLGRVDGHGASVPARKLIRVVAESDLDSEPSDTYGATSASWLVVDGFDRVLGGSYREPTHAFAALVGGALGEGFSTSSNEAVAEGRVSLGDYPKVLWLLGDESVADVTFDAAERAAIRAFLAGGGDLIVSGSEVGFATPASFLTELHAGYVKDDAGTDRAGGFRFGVTYPEDFPDVLSGETTLWSYDTGGAAAVGWAHRIVVVGFPLETLATADLGPAVADLVEWLDAR